MSMKQELDRLIQSEIDAGDLAGSALSIIKDGREVFRGRYGKADLASGAPMPDEPIFRMYSMSKPVTSAAAMLLLERGVISLDDPVYKYLDGFRNQQVWQDDHLVQVERPVTIKDLLNMTSGLTYPDMATEPGRRMDALFEEGKVRANSGNGWTTVEFCNLIGQQPLVFHPGSHWQYGTSADILGAVIEVASGMTLRSFLKKEIFDPLGMIDTDFYVPADKWDRFATMYEWQADEPKLTPYLGSHLVVLDFRNAPAFESGGAGLASTLSDYGRFARMLMNYGELDGVRILKPETVAFMRSDQLDAHQLEVFRAGGRPGCGYGNLIHIRTEPDKADPAMQGVLGEGEYGWGGWAGTHHSSDPTSRIIVLYYISRINFDCQPMRTAMHNIIAKYLK